MKLLYLYMSEAGPLQDCELNFDSDWTFNLKKDESANLGCLLIKFTYRNILPNDMWRIKDVEGVESISAIIGDNKSGKTSIAASLSQVYCGAGIVKHTKYKGEYVRYVAIGLVDGAIRVFSNQPCAFDDESMNRLSNDVRDLFSGCGSVTIPSIRSDITESLGYLYYSPSVTTEAVIAKSKDPELFFWDLSATKALSAAQTYKEYQLSQRQKVFNFLRNMKHLYHDVFDKIIGMSLPYRAVITKSSEVASDFMSWVERRAANDNRYVKLRDMMTNQEIIVLMIVDYVFKALSWSYIVEDKTPDEFGYVNSNWLEEEIFSLVLTLGRRMRMTVDTMSTDPVPNEERIKCVKYAISKISEIAERVDDDDYQILRIGDFSVAEVKDGLVFFEKYLDCLRHPGFDVCPDGLGFSMSDEQQINYIWELINADKNGYVELGYSPRLSSGEMSYFSAFASIFELLSQEDKKDGVRPLPKHLLIFLDEAESSLHPELQRKLIWAYNIFLSELFPEKKFHVIFASHSPQLLSDLPKGNVVWLQADQKHIEEKNDFNTFGANIFDLYRLAFNQKNGTTGSFASTKIKEALAEVAEVVKSKISCRGTSDEPKELSDASKLTLSLIGDDIIKRYLNGLIDGGLL